MSPPFRADHIGSLIRPSHLIEAQRAISDRIQMHNVDYSGADPELVRKVKDAEKTAIEEAVGEQVRRGIIPITSGEYERPSFVSGFYEVLDGVEIREIERARFRTEHPIMRPYIRLGLPGRDQPIATGKVRWKQSAYLHEFEYMTKILPEHLWKEVKITIPSPSWSHTQLKDGEAYTKEAYTNDDEYLRDVGEAVRQEILALYEAGVRFVQIDDPMYAMMVDEEYLTAQKAEGVSLDALLDPSIIAHNAAIRDLPSDLTVAMHLCRGNLPKGSLAAVGGYQDMASTLFNKLHYKRFALEYDNAEITGDFIPLQHLPSDKIVVLGIVTTKDSELEDISALKAQVLEAADIIAKAQGKTREQALKDNLAVSPSCGFSSVHPISGTGMTFENQWQKLELVKKLAEEIWGTS